jgi:hypothetical protein
VRFNFRELPDPTTHRVRPRPIVDIVVEGLDIAPQACLLDSGATAIRIGAHLAELCAVDLSDVPEARLAVGGALVHARMAEVSLEVGDAFQTITGLRPSGSASHGFPRSDCLG